MPPTPLEKGWLSALVTRELGRHDPEAGLARLPGEVREGHSTVGLLPAARLLVARSLRFRRLDTGSSDATAAFLDEVGRHVVLLLDLAVLQGGPYPPERRRAEIATFLAAAVGDVQAALDVLPTAPIPPRKAGVEHALSVAEIALTPRFHPPGDPVQGLPLHPGTVAVFRRLLMRVAIGFHRKRRLDTQALGRHAAYAERETVLLAEAIAGLVAAPHPPDGHARAVRDRQIGRLGLSRGAARLARAAVAAPRAPAELAAATPEGVRPFLLEQLFLAQLRANLTAEPAARFVEAFVAAAGFDPAAVAAARIEAAAQHGDHQVWFEMLDGGRSAVGWQALAGDWEAATDAVVERVTSAVTDNLSAIVTEIRETGELGQLLARAAAGYTLSMEERRKVRAQLIDLAKAVPALAIFAAPGGMLLLPLLAKLLPFSLLPSAWDRQPGSKEGGSQPDGKPPGAAPPKVEPVE